MAVTVRMDSAWMRDEHMSRAVDEWTGKTDDEPVPPRVRLRVFLRFDGQCQGGCGRRIIAGKRWVCDHKQAIINGGENREKNLQPICDLCNRTVKTPADIAEKALTYRKRVKHLGIKRAGRTIPGRRFNGEPIPSRART